MHLARRFAFAVALTLSLVLGDIEPYQPAFAEDSLEGLVHALAEGSFTDKERSVAELAGTGDPRVVPVLDALLAGDLFQVKADGRVVIAEKRGRVVLLRSPLTLVETGEAKTSELRKIRVNNRLRRAIRAALGSLNLFSPERELRATSAVAIFNSRAAETELPLIRAIERESDDGVREALEKALAAVQLGSADSATRLAAVQSLRRFALPDVRALLSTLLMQDDQGAYGEPDDAVRAAAATALEEIEQRLALWQMAGNLFQGLSVGSVLVLAAMGLAITFGVMGVINMAHGEMVMLGAYSTFMVQELFRTFWPGLFDWSVLVAIPCAFAVTAVVGILIERSVIRHLYGRPLETLLATWGISLVLQQTVRSIFGPTNQQVGNPSWMSGAMELTGGVVITFNRLWIIVFSLVVFFGVLVILRRTRFGLNVRAVTQNRRMASSMGINTGTVDALTFGLGSGIAGMAGVALSQIDKVSPNLGQAYIIDSFMVVVFGGVGNLWGTLVGGLSLGVINKVLEPWTGAVLGKILVLVAIILFIQKRPRGLFALKGRAVEA